MPINIPANRCRACGATSYKPVLARDAAGAMRPSLRYQCTGCDVTFTALTEWRDGERVSFPAWTPATHASGPVLA